MTAQFCRMSTSALLRCSVFALVGCESGAWELLMFRSRASGFDAVVMIYIMGRSLTMLGSICDQNRSQKHDIPEQISRIQ
jgi:hypothetical protein